MFIRLKVFLGCCTRIYTRVSEMEKVSPYVEKGEFFLFAVLKGHLKSRGGKKNYESRNTY